MTQKGEKKTRAQKKIRWFGLGFGLLFAASSAVSIVSRVQYPTFRNAAFPGDGECYKTIHDQGGDAFYALGTKGTLSYFESGEKKHSKNILNDINSTFSASIPDGIEIIDGVYSFPESSRLFVAASNRSLRNYYVFAYDGRGSESLSLSASYATVDGSVSMIAYDGSDVFTLSSSKDNYNALSRFDASTLALEKTGVVYSVRSSTSTSGAVELVPQKNLKSLHLAVSGDYLYLTTDGGFFRVKKDGMGYDYEPLILARVNQKYADFEAAEGHAPSRDEKKALRLEAYEEIKAERGILDYDSSSCAVTIPSSLWDESSYGFYLPESISFSGAMFRKADGKFYVTSYGRTVSSIDPAMFDSMTSFSTEGFVLNDLPNVNLPAIPRGSESTDGTGLIASPFRDSFFLLYKSDTTYNAGDVISRFDLETGKVAYSISAAVSITAAFEGSDGELFYIHTNNDEATVESNGRYALTHVSVESAKRSSLLAALFLAFLIVAAITLALTITCVLAYFKKKTMGKVLDTIDGVKKHWAIYLLLAGSLTLLIMFCYYPGISSIITSFAEYGADNSFFKDFSDPFVNYAKIFTSIDSWRSFGNMLFFLFFDLVTAFGPPLIFAFFLTVMRYKKLSGVIRTLLFIPAIIPGIASAMIWRYGIYGPDGVIAQLFGLQNVPWFDSANWNNAWLLILAGFPFVGSYLIFYGAMMNIPKSYYEAAELDGITVWKRFFKIDLPLIRPQLKYVLILTIIHSVQNFGRTQLFFGGSVGAAGALMTPIQKMYDLMMEKKYGESAAYASIIFVLLFGFTFLSMKKRRSELEGDK